MKVETKKSPVSTIKRPTGVTLLIAGVLSIAVWNFVRAVYGFRYRQVLDDLLPFPSDIIGLIGILWGLLMSISVWGLLKRTRWAPRFTRWISVGYFVYFWLDHIFFRHPDNRKINSIFPVVVSIAVPVLILIVLQSRATKEYFGETNEQPRA